METSIILWIILGFLSGLSPGVSVLPGTLTAAVGDTVTFLTSVTPPVQPFLVVTWSVDDSNGTTTNIITSTNENLTHPTYLDRITLFRSTGSLELRNLTLDDSGKYQILIIPDGEAHVIGTCRLEMHAKISNVVVTPSTTDLVEFTSSVRLSCSSSGSSLSFLWLNGSSEVTASDRVQLTDGNTNLTIVNVTRYDQGPFRCRVSNAVSEGTSDEVNLSISYGPDNVKLEKLSSQEQYVVGSDIELSCSAVSSPSAQFSWFLNESLLPDTGPKLSLSNIQMNQSGSYSCQAFNSKTRRYQTSQPALIFVLETVEVFGPTKLEERQTLVLFCSVESTLPKSYTWTLNGKETLKNSAVFIKHTSESSDSGTYVCKVRDDQTGSLSVGEHSVSVQACAGLSAGAIAGIVMSYVLIIGAALGGGFYIYKKKTSSNKTQPQNHSCKKDKEESLYENDFAVYENSK